MTLAAVRTFFRGYALRQLRITCGVIMFSYLVSHFLNHSLGNISYEAMKEGLKVHMAIWRFQPIAIALYSALTIHASLGLWALYQRRHFNWKVPEITQLVLGLTLPALMAQHLIGLRMPQYLWDMNRYYAHALSTYLTTRPDQHIMTIVGLFVAWTHGCIGLFFWLRMRTFFRRAAPLLLAFAILLPTLAVTGFYHAGRDFVSRPADFRKKEITQPSDKHQRVLTDRLKDYGPPAWVVIVLLVFIARGVRDLRERRKGTIEVSYPGGRRVKVPQGYSVLETSLRYRIPHATVCGGRGRCSTCRVRILSDCGLLPSPSRREAAILEKIEAPSNIRLACQLRPTANVTVAPLIPAGARAIEYMWKPRQQLTGSEQEVCVLFADLRGFTRFSEKKLPYDVVFFLNRYFEAMGSAIERCNGVPNQFVGDGIMALFGTQSNAKQGCRDATEAAKLMVQKLGELGDEFADQLDEPLRMGIGIHVGTAVVGRMGRGVAMYLTAVGDTVHVASRLQDLTKEYKCQLIISELTAQQAGLEVSAYPAFEVVVRNRSDAVPIRTVTDIGVVRFDLGTARDSAAAQS
jgi:adenylate cyclase